MINSKIKIQINRLISTNTNNQTTSVPQSEDNHLMVDMDRTDLMVKVALMGKQALMVKEDSIMVKEDLMDMMDKVDMDSKIIILHQIIMLLNSSKDFKLHKVLLLHLKITLLLLKIIHLHNLKIILHHLNSSLGILMGISEARV